MNQDGNPNDIYPDLEAAGIGKATGCFLFLFALGMEIWNFFFPVDGRRRGKT